MGQAVTASDPAPALTRGLELLRRLERDGAASLERLVRDTAWPKSSVARLLLSLENAAAVWRDPVTRRYHARVHLVAVDDAHDRLAAAWRPVADRLAAAACHTVELHRFDAGRLVMVDRLEPEDAVVTAKARIGFERDFRELEALTQVVFAFGLPERDWPEARPWVWRDGRRRPITAGRRAQVVDRVRRDGVATDLGVNTNGVFRYAAPVFTDGRLRAVLAIAQVCTPAAAAPDATLTRLVADAGRELSNVLSPSTFPLRSSRET